MPKTSTPFPALLIFNVIVFGIAGYYFTTGLSPVLMTFIGMFVGSVLTTVLFLLFGWLGKQLKRLPLSVNAAVLGALVSLVLLKSTAFRWPDQLYYPVILLGIFFSVVIYYGLKQLKRHPNSVWPYVGMILAVIFLVSGLQWLHNEGRDPYLEELLPPFEKAQLPTLSDRGLENAGERGPYAVSTFTYGSGTDQQRPEYAGGVTYRTPTVDASGVLTDWKGKKKKWRERYWGFGVVNFPLNGRVHLPVGAGPFPLILIVHGNHSMIDYSDGGYAYLGELLASRGFITVSVDENFINGHWSGDFRGKEMPARAWLLLKHLEVWDSWNKDTRHEMAGKVDMDKIMLIGHSRGGEAVSIAAAFNRLPYYPDDGTIPFDFNFNIRGVVAIAPTDYRYHRQISLENINFLSLQGSYDADETSFWGMRAYRRLQFTDNENWFKAGVYLHRANHGQFNSSWGRSDFGGPFTWLLNRGALISGEDQRLAAKIFISAFAEAALHGNRKYLPIFKNVNMARDWLPENYYLTHYADTSCHTIVDFEDDLDLTTGGPQAAIQTTNLKIWREEELSTRGGGSQENKVVSVGWDYGETMETDSVASFEITLLDTLFRKIDSNGAIRLVTGGGDPQTMNKLTGTGNSREEADLDFRIVLEDDQQQTAETILSHTKSIKPRLKSRFMKLRSLDMAGKEWEVQPETFYLPLRSFRTQSESFDFTRIRKIRFVFDQSPYGVLILDDLGFTYGAGK